MILPKELEALPDNILDAIHGAFFGCDVGGGPINAAADAVVSVVSPLLAEKDANKAWLQDQYLDQVTIAGNASARAETAEARVKELEAALSRQGDNMAFVLNHVDMPNQWQDKFSNELADDRRALKGYTHAAE